MKAVTAKERSILINDYAREEQNMFYLRHPYLTIVSWFWKWQIHSHREIVITDAKYLLIYLHTPLGGFCVLIES